DAEQRDALRGSQQLDRREPGREPRAPRAAAAGASSAAGLGREEIARLLANCLPVYRDLVAAAIYTGMRLSELLGLTWDDVEFNRGLIHVRAQLSRSHIGAPARRVAPKTRAAARQIPLTPQLAGLLRDRRLAATRSAGGDWVFSTR